MDEQEVAKEIVQIIKNSKVYRGSIHRGMGDPANGTTREGPPNQKKPWRKVKREEAMAKREGPANQKKPPRMTLRGGASGQKG